MVLHSLCTKKKNKSRFKAELHEILNMWTMRRINWRSNNVEKMLQKPLALMAWQTPRAIHAGKKLNMNTDHFIWPWMWFSTKADVCPGFTRMITLSFSWGVRGFISLISQRQFIMRQPVQHNSKLQNTKNTSLNPQAKKSVTFVTDIAVVLDPNHVLILFFRIKSMSDIEIFFPHQFCQL